MGGSWGIQHRGCYKTGGGGCQEQTPSKRPKRSSGVDLVIWNTRSEYDSIGNPYVNLRYETTVTFKKKQTKFAVHQIYKIYSERLTPLPYIKGEIADCSEDEEWVWRLKPEMESMASLVAQTKAGKCKKRSRVHRCKKHISTRFAIFRMKVGL